jgi:hypothetical protein
VIALTAVSCARFSTDVSYPEELLSTTLDQPPPRDRALVATVSTNPSGITIAVVERSMCDTQPVESYRKYEYTVRTEIGNTIAGEYIYGIAGAVAGGIFFAIADGYPEEPPPGQPDAFTQSKSIGLGVAFVATGLISLIAAVSDSFRARDSRSLHSEYELRPEERRETAPCDQQAVSTAVALLAAAPVDAERASLGMSDDGGQLRVEWSAIPQAWVRGNHPVVEARVVVGNGGASDTFSIAPARTYWAERAWDEARTTGTSSAFAAYRNDYAEHHAAEADAAWHTARVGELTVEIDRALAAGDAQRSKRIVTELGVLLGATDELVAYFERVNALLRTHLRASIETAVSEPFADDAAVEAVIAMVDELESVGGAAVVVDRLRARVARRAAELAARR